MKTTHAARLESELAKFTPEQLDRPMYDLEVVNGSNIPEIDALVSEVGYPSAKAYVNDGRGWGRTLRETITNLVGSLYTLNGQTIKFKSSTWSFVSSRDYPEGSILGSGEMARTYVSLDGAQELYLTQCVGISGACGAFIRPNEGDEHHRRCYGHQVTWDGEWPSL